MARTDTEALPGLSVSKNGHYPALTASPAFPDLSTAAPSSFVVRARHPTLGGPLYASSLPARNNPYTDFFLTPVYNRLGEDLSIRTGGLRYLLDQARHGTQSVQKAEQDAYALLERQQTEARSARDAYPARAAQVHLAMQQATEALHERLRTVEEEIAAIQRLAMRAQMEAPLPLSLIQRSETRKAAKTSAAPPPAQAVPPVNIDLRRVGTAMVVSGSKLILGGVVGLSIGLNLQFLTRAEMLHFSYDSPPWMALFAGAGAGALWLLSRGMTGWWAYAGERSAREQAPEAGGINWRSARHTLGPFAFSALVCAMEASILRNAQVASPLVRDPGNWAYLVGNLALVLPVTLEASVSGWKQGRATGERQGQQSAQAQVEEAREVSVAQVPEARVALALSTYVETLEGRREEIREEIALREAPYRTLLSHYEAEMEAPTELSETQRLCLEAAREDAIAANVVFKQKHALYEEALEPLPKTTSPFNLTVCFMRQGDAPVPDASRPKRSLWQRVKDAFRGRRNRKKAATGEKERAI